MVKAKCSRTCTLTLATASTSRVDTLLESSPCSAKMRQRSAVSPSINIKSEGQTVVAAERKCSCHDSRIRAASITNNSLVTSRSPDTHYVRHITNISFERVGLTEWPKCLELLSGLKELRIRSSHKLSQSECIPRFPSTLEILDLSDNALEILPHTIFALNSLRVLNLRRNHIKCLPVSIANLINLKVLHLDSNKLECGPSQLARLTELGQITWKGNPLLEPSDHGLPTAVHGSLPSLLELCSRVYATSSMRKSEDAANLCQDVVEYCEAPRYCEGCSQLYFQNCYYYISWELLGMSRIPLRFEFCCFHCAQGSRQERVIQAENEAERNKRRARRFGLASSS
eukprot:Colp12_sorted_trinity150504_noHs@29056